MTTKEIENYNAYANFLICWIPFFEANEALKGTNIYRQDIKHLGKKLEGALDKKFITERYACLYESDPGAVIHMTERLHSFFKEIVKLSPDEWTLLGICVTEIRKNKDWVMDRLNVVSGEATDMDEMRERDDLIQSIKNAPIAAVRYAKKNIEQAKNIFK